VANGGRAMGPDIVFFMMDQLAAKWLEVARAGAAPLPHFERLAGMGTNFRRCVSSNPLCCPARATLATGLSTRGHGVLQNGYYLDGSIPTFMRLLQEAGYQTGGLGKIHFHPHYSTLHPDYRPYGYDVQHITEDGRGGEWLDWIRSEHAEQAGAVYSTVWAREIPEFGEYGPDGEDLAADMAKVPVLRGAYELPFPEELSQTNWITGHAVDFMGTADVGRPLLAHISYVQPHSPFAPPAGYRKFVDMAKVPGPVEREWRDDALGPVCFDGLANTDNIEFGWEEAREHYFADLVHLDAQLGKVLEALDRRGRLADTYILLLSDHGEMLFDHGMVSKGEMHYDACVRVPLMIAGPGVERGRERDEFAQLEDIFPTVMEMAGLELPEPLAMRLKLDHEVLPGRSLLPLCRGERVEGWRDAAYVESYNNIDSNTPANWARTVRTAEWRYTMYPQGNGEQLFNLVDDPDEQVNLAGEAEFAEVRSEMRDRLLEMVILQDYPHSPRSRFAYDVH
jgi:arylsulfatase